MSVIATIEAGEVMRKILGHLGLPTEPPSPLAARPPPLAVRRDRSHQEVHALHIGADRTSPHSSTTGIAAARS